MILFGLSDSNFMRISDHIIKELLDNHVICSAYDIQNCTFTPPAPYNVYDFSVRVKTQTSMQKQFGCFILIKQYEIIGNYINIILDRDCFFDALWHHISDNHFGFIDSCFTNKIIAVEHTSITPVYPINLATFRSSVIGNAIKNFLTFLGSHVETHFFVEDMAQQLELLETGIIKTDIDLENLEENEKIDHVVGRIFTSAYIAKKPLSRASDQIRSMFPYSRNISFSNNLNLVKPEKKTICDFFLKGIKETLDMTKIMIDFFDYESDYVFNINKLDFKEPEIIQMLIDKDKKIPYYLRNSAYFSKMSAKYDLFITVISKRQRTVIAETFNSLVSSQNLQAVFFDDVLITDYKTSVLDSIREGVFHSVDQYIDTLSKWYSKPKEEICQVLKLKMLSTKLSNVCYIDFTENGQYSKGFKIIEFYYKYRKAQCNYDKVNLYSKHIWNLCKKLAQLENVISKTLCGFHFHVLTDYMFSLYETLAEIEYCYLENRIMHDIVMRVFSILFSILGLE